MENWLKTDMVHGRTGDAEIRELTRLINKKVLQEIVKSSKLYTKVI